MNQKMQRIFGVLIVLSLILAACGGGAAPATPAPEPQASQSEAPTAEPPADQSSEPTAEPPAVNPDNTPTAEAQPAVASDTPGVVADLGFRPEVNGFQFENYGKSDAKNLTPG